MPRRARSLLISFAVSLLWAPESYVAQTDSYLSPSLDAAGRSAQHASRQEEAKDSAGAAELWKKLLAIDVKDGFA